MGEVWRVTLVDLEGAVERAFATGRTPLIVDPSSADNVCTFYSYRTTAQLLEAKQIILRGRNSSDVSLLEPFRQSLVGAMRNGQLLVVRLANAAPSLFCKWNDEALQHNNTARGSAYFPRDVFFEGGKRLRENDWPARLLRPTDNFPNKDVAFCRDEFQVCFTTQFELEDVDDFLFETEALPPREHFQLIYIFSADDKQR